MIKRDPKFIENTMFPFLRKIIASGYLTLDVKGAENVPCSGPIIYASNHSGWFAFDACLIALAIRDHVDPSRVPYPIVHDFLFKVPGVNRFLEKTGAIPASNIKRPNQLCRDVENFGIFPEGADGMCKPLWDCYRMKTWKTGFVRLAISHNLTIVPLAMIGMEESLPTLSSLNTFKSLIGSAIPIPAFPFPLPTQCKIVFCKPIELPSFSKKMMKDKTYQVNFASEVRSIVQNVLDEETQGRPLIKAATYVRGLKALLAPQSRKQLPVL